MTSWQIIEGDCVEQMREIESESIDAIVTDPPYELGFMGKGWDASGIANSVEMWSEALRILKPGGHLLAFGGTRTYHRMVCAVEDAGFEIRDQIAWMFGSGFPKSLDVSKAIDRQRHDAAEIRQVTRWIAETRARAGVTNADIDNAFGFNGMAGHWTTQGAQAAVPTLDQVPRLLEVLGVDEVPGPIRTLIFDLNGAKGQPGEAWFRREKMGEREVPIGHAFAGPTYGGDSTNRMVDQTAPATPEAQQWQGWGTALKPAFEPIVVARKPLMGTVAVNVLEHGTGALNVDGCRIAADGEVIEREEVFDADTTAHDGYVRPGTSKFTNKPKERSGPAQEAGRWPANVVLDTEAGAMLDEQTGESRSRIGQPRGAASGDGWGMTATGSEYDDAGGASRFFYCAKTSSAERNAGLSRCECKIFTEWANADQSQSTQADSGTPPQRATTEPISEDDSEWSMTGPGNRPTDQSQKDSTSTTSTATSKTTDSKISPSSTPSPISDSTPRTTGKSKANGNDAAQSAASGSQQPPSISTSPKKAGSAMDDVDPARSEPSSNPSSESGLFCPECGGLRGGHPTVKPIALMRWLVRMVTPPGGTLLDPFNGSGSTGCAAVLEGFDYIGIDREAEYVAIAEARIKWWAEHPEGMGLGDRLKAEKARGDLESLGQDSLFPEAA